MAPLVNVLAFAALAAAAPLDPWQAWAGPVSTVVPVPVVTTSSARVSTTASSIKVSTTASSTRVSTTIPSVRTSTTASSIRVSTTASSIRVSTTASSIRVSTTASSTRVSTTAPSVRTPTTASSTRASTTASSVRPPTTASSTRASTTASSVRPPTTASSVRASTMVSSTRAATAASSSRAAVASPAALVNNNHTPLIKQADCPTEYQVQYGPRPYYIINNMTASPLKTKLQSCANGPFSVSGWSIGHRGGGTLQIPEESAESQDAGARMGAGVLECDVAFTSDRKLVCRHSLCDLHTTTDILLRPALAAKCTRPFSPANGTARASALCCTSDITEAEYLTLCSKMDGSNSSATTPAAYQSGTPTFRTDLYNTCAKPLSLNGYIDLVNSYPGYRNFTPELKTPPSDVPMPFKGYTQQQYARDMINAFIAKNIAPERVWAQSFLPDDIYQWIKEFPRFGSQAVYLDEEGDTPATYVTAVARLASLKAKGVNVIAPPINYLLTYGDASNKTIVPSSYAIEAKRVGLDIISWTFDRSGPLTRVRATEDYYYATFNQAVSYDGQLYEILDILANKIGIIGLFSDWSATTGYFANCFGLKGPQGGKYYNRNWVGYPRGQ